MNRNKNSNHRSEKCLNSTDKQQQTVSVDIVVAADAPDAVDVDVVAVVAVVTAVCFV